MPTAIKFHYLFNLRDLSNVFQGLLFASNECVTTPTELVRLWCHETQRVYLDKLADSKDIDVFEKMQKDYMKKSFDDIPEAEALRKPLIYCHFARYNFWKICTKCNNNLKQSLLSWFMTS